MLILIQLFIVACEFQHDPSASSARGEDGNTLNPTKNENPLTISCEQINYNRDFKVIAKCNVVDKNKIDKKFPETIDNAELCFFEGPSSSEETESKNTKKRYRLIGRVEGKDNRGFYVQTKIAVEGQSKIKNGELIEFSSSNKMTTEVEFNLNSKILTFTQVDDRPLSFLIKGKKLRSASIFCE
jgi:hypothetical protein